MNEAELRAEFDLWQTVHAHLDAGRDPLDDPAVQAALLADAHALERVVALRGVLTGVSRWGGAARPRRARPLRPWVAAAAALFVIGALVVCWPARRAREIVPGTLPMPKFATAGAVRHVIAELCVQAGDKLVWVQREGGVLTCQRSALVAIDAEPPTPGRSAMVVALAYYENQLR